MLLLHGTYIVYNKYVYMYIYALIYIVNAHKYDFIADQLHTNCASLNTKIHYPSVSNSIRYKYVLCIRDRFYHFNFCMYVSRLRREAGLKGSSIVIVDGILTFFFVVPALLLSKISS